MKDLRFNFYRKIFGFLLILFLINIVVESRQIFGSPVIYKFQQTKQIRKSKKIKKRVVKKVVKKKKFTAVSSGVWGGVGIRFVVEDRDVQIEYDCAEGEIKQKLVTDENGIFNFNGFHKYQTPVIRVDLIPKPQAANFQGKISGSTMNLKVTLTETKEVIGEYTLTRGKTPVIRKCR